MSKSFKNHILSLILIIIVGLIAYKNSFSVPFHYDDNAVILDNEEIRGLDTFLGNLSLKEPRPLLMLTFALNYEINGLNVFGYHIVNFFFHVLTAFMIYLITSFILKQLSIPSNRDSAGIESYLSSLFPSLIFLCHPLATESVTYISSRSSVLSAFFYVLSLFLFIKAGDVNKLHRTCYTISLLSFLMALGFKEIAITLPATVLLYDYFFKSNVKMKRIKWKYFYYPCGIILFLLLLFNYSFAFTLSSPDNTARSLQSHILTELYIIPCFLWKFLIPTNLNIDHDVEIISSVFNVRIIFSIGFWVLLILTIKRLFASIKLLSFSLAWVTLTIAPYLVFRLRDFMAERWLYLPLIGFSFFAAAILGKSKDKGISKTAICIVLAVIFFFAFGTIKRNKVYGSKISLWADAIKKSPLKARPHYNLGTVYYDTGSIDDAIEHYKVALELNPDFPEAHDNLGVAYKFKGFIDKAMEHYKIALRLKPDYPRAHNNLGNAKKDKGLMDEAIEHYLRAIRLKPDFPEAHYNLAIVYHEKGSIDEAIDHYKTAVKINYDEPGIYNNLGIAYQMKGLVDDAIENYKRAVRLKPDYLKAHNNLAIAYEEKGLTEKALEHYTIVLNLNPGLADIRKKVKRILANGG